MHTLSLFTDYYSAAAAKHKEEIYFVTLNLQLVFLCGLITFSSQSEYGIGGKDGI